MLQESVNHIYFNAKASNINGITDRKTVFNTRSDASQPIIDSKGKQGAWEVCVDRFKIPSGDIPQVRIYKDELLLGVDYDQTVYLAKAESPPDIFANQNIAMVDLFQIAGGLPAAKLDKEASKYYIDCASHEEFTKVLNCALQYSMTPRTNQSRTYQTPDLTLSPPNLQDLLTISETDQQIFRRIHTNKLNMPFGFFNIPLGVSPGSGVNNATLSEPSSLIKAFAYQSVVDLGGTPHQPTKDSRRLTDFVIEMPTLSPSLNSSLSMSDLVLIVKLSIRTPGQAIPSPIQSTTEGKLDMYVVVTKQYIMAKNFFPNVLVQDFNTMFPFGVKFSLFSTLNGEGFVPDKPQTEAPIFGFYDAERMRDEILLEYGDYTDVEILVNVLSPQPLVNSSAVTLSGTFAFDRTTTNSPNFRDERGSSYSDSHLKNTVSTLPRIHYSNKKMIVMLEETYLSNGLTIYLNEALNSMMSYKSSIMNTLNLAQSKLFQYTNGLEPVQSNQVQVTGNLAVLKLEEDYSTSSGVGYSSTYIENAAASPVDKKNSKHEFKHQQV